MTNKGRFFLSYKNQINRVLLIDRLTGAQYAYSKADHGPAYRDIARQERDIINHPYQYQRAA